ncbi:hypothetical protein [Wolbachia endosymbiont of Madathamugadia hiepei]|uniref:hypothetical protein n=1 Tax=Wolbachia endosymbiont of Madathamugadia hiepei TaxID=1241303 RepID=UPI0015886A53|nr:hypothetical protein [Wolbachia endosymbiont of Madathamugadia hiepei]
MNAVVGPGIVIGLTNGGLGKKEPIAVSSSVKEGKFFGGMTSGFNIPLSIFRYEGYDSDFFTPWYNILREIFEEIKRMCPEKRVLNLALLVLMLPYIASVSLGLVVYNRSKADGKIQASPEGNETKKSEVSESTAKRLAYSVLAAIAILVNIVVLVTLIIPATLALATFYLSSKKLSHSLIATVKIGSGLYKNEHQNIEVSFHEIDAGESDIRWDMEIKFPPQFEQLLKDLREDKNDKLFVTQDAEHNTILKLSANIHLKNGLKPLRNEIRGVLATSIQGFTKAMGELLKLDKKDITYGKLQEFFNEFRLKAVNSVDSKLTSHLIQDAHKVAFIQAIKIVQQRRKEGFSLEERLKEVLVEQELKSQGKELPSKKRIVKHALKNLGKKDKDKEEIPRAVDVCESVYPKETEKVLDNAEQEIERLRKIGQKRYDEMYEKLKEICENGRTSNSTDGALRRKLEDLFKFEYDGQEVEKKLMESKIRKAKVVLSQSGVLNKEKQCLMERLEDLEKEVKGLSNEEASDKINDFIEVAYSEIVKHGVQNLLGQQKKMLLKKIEDLVSLLNESKGMYDGEDNEVTLLFDRRLEDILHLEKMIKECLEQKEYDLLKEKIEKQSEDIRKSMRNGKDLLCFLDKDLIDGHLGSNRKFIKLLEQLGSEKEELLISEEAKNDYREELTSREKIKFAIIEDDLLEIFKQKTFNEEEIKKLLEKAELEYYLAEKCIKYPVIRTKDNIKHFCQALLSPLIGNLVEKIINHVSKDNKSNAWSLTNLYKRFRIAINYNIVGLSATNDSSTEGKALKVAHDTYEEVKTLLKYFESSYEEVRGLIGNVFSDDGETFKKNIWPKIKNHLCEVWDRFFKGIEFTLISKDKNINQETVNTELGQFTIQKHNSIGGLVAGA